MLRILSVAVGASLVVGCGSVAPSKFENGQYVPPPAANPLSVELDEKPCNPAAAGAPPVFVAALLSVAGPFIVNQTYDRFVNWLEEKQANLSASSTGVATTTFLFAADTPKQCLRLKRADSLSAEFNIKRVGDGQYWNMTPYSVRFNKSEAKESSDAEKSIVATIAFSTPSADGKSATFFQATFDLGKRKAGPMGTFNGIFIGQDSGPHGVPKVDGKDKDITIKVVASLTEHGDGRDWVRGAVTTLRDQENRDKLVKPLIDAINGK